jgi:chemotaxis protein MotB
VSEKKGSVRPIIVVKKKTHGHGHHGGAWKVAFADFMTAMMAFFLVMWIMGMDSQTKEMVEGYFSNPVGFKKAFSGGANPMSSGNSPQNLNVKRLALAAKQFQAEQFETVRKGIQEKLAESAELRGLMGQVEVVVTEEGLRIELLESGTGDTFFESGSAALKPVAHQLLLLIGEELGTVPNDIVLEGHTDAKPYGGPGYSNWELSVDRANAARRALTESGISAARIAEVRGYADRNLRDEQNPLAAANRRTSILLPFKEPKKIRSFDGSEPVLPGMAAH